MHHPKIHVYGPYAHHDDNFIVGNREGLEGLRDAINRVLEDGEPNSVGAFAEDGEGFNLFVIAEEDDEKWIKMELPYEADYAKSPQGATWPADLISKDRYTELHQKAWNNETSDPS